MENTDKRFQRPIFPLLAAYAVGLWVGREFDCNGYSFFLWASLFVASAGYALFRRHEVSLARTTLVLCLMMVAIGGLRIAPIAKERLKAMHLLESIAAQNDSAPHTIEGTVFSAETRTETKSGSLILEEVRASGPKCSWHMPSYAMLTWTDKSFETSTPVSFLPGDRIRVPGKLIPIRGYLNGTRQLSETRALKRVYATVKKDGPIRVFASRSPFTRTLAQLCDTIRDSLLLHIPGNSGKLAASMLLNDRTLLDDQKRDAFSTSGLFHVFAVSGLHIILLAGILTIVLRALRIPVYLSTPFVILLLMLYTWMLQFNPPVLRSTIMFSMLAAGSLMKRPTDALTRFAVSVIVILFFDPLALWQSGMHLSVLCVGSLILVAPTIQLWIYDRKSSQPQTVTNKIRSAAAQNAAILLAVFLILLPAQLFYFQQCNLLSPIANFIGVPLVGLAMPGALLTLILAPFSDTLSSLAGAGTAFLFRILDLWAATIGHATPFIIRIGTLPGWVPVIIYGVIFSAYFTSPRDTPEYRAKSLARFLMVYGSILCLLIFISLLSHSTPTGNVMRIWYMDVGQGDATLVETPQKHYVLIDSGPGTPNAARLVVLPKLASLGTATLDTFIATHSDADHVGSLDSLARGLTIQSYLCSGSEQERIRLNSGKVSPNFLAPTTTEMDFGDGPVFEIMNNTDYATSKSSSRNSNSLVVQIRWNNFSTLITGDADQRAEHEIIANDPRIRHSVSVLKAGHHGSQTSTGEAFLQVIHPENAVISVGAHNRFGHPSREVLQRLQRMNTQVFRTDLDGGIEICTDGECYSIQKMETQ